MPSCKAVIFDLDGTLCYTFEDILTSMNETLGVLSYPQITRQRLLEIINNGSKNLVRKALPGFAADDESLFSEAYDLYDAIYALHCADSTTLYDGIAEVNKQLRQLRSELKIISDIRKDIPHMDECLQEPAEPSKEQEDYYRYNEEEIN